MSHWVTQANESDWLALAIGNSRLHWAYFLGNQLQHTWNTPHLDAAAAQYLINHQFDFSSLFPQLAATPIRSHLPPLWIASVVSEQSAFWQDYSLAHLITLEQVPLQSMYSTLGIDRALAVLGAISTVSQPVLVVDAGTALTFTGADSKCQLVGGAILPGLRLQFQALNQGTALPFVQPDRIPPRWATTTTEAIASGVIHTLLAGLKDFVAAWWQQFPNSAVMLTGGDGDRLHRYLTEFSPELASKIVVDPHLIFWGIQAVRSSRFKRQESQLE